MIDLTPPVLKAPHQINLDGDHHQSPSIKLYHVVRVTIMKIMELIFHCHQGTNNCTQITAKYKVV